MRASEFWRPHFPDAFASFHRFSSIRRRCVECTNRKTPAAYLQFVIDLPTWVTASSADAVVADAMKHWLKQRVRRDVSEIARAYGDRFDLRPRAVHVAEFVTGWGSCGQKRTVNIDWRLVFAPKRVLEYVVVHELAHLKHRSHGPKFWDFLRKLLHDVDRPNAWLDSNQGKLNA
jgi:predicted metal-dependent hydrolase